MKRYISICVIGSILSLSLYFVSELLLTSFKCPSMEFALKPTPPQNLMQDRASGSSESQDPAQSFLIQKNDSE